MYLNRVFFFFKLRTNIKYNTGLKPMLNEYFSLFLLDTENDKLLFTIKSQIEKLSYNILVRFIGCPENQSSSC